ncbi:hypothetical protein [Corynebacterium diphtheriae]|uniref:hypothetical protein n=1 Tax=Corynebacterium diphtheriae TaxID=1717 RepID=UPI000B4B5A19|nr:hypothetical protein [Corynebacterium diphtheriae]OWO24069.1 hypothetical protein AY535_08725 [Corynebacterium diphtheriae bv. gravis]CAB0518253.1 hypothetical protein CIP101280_01701 [Corynebacterium diphtheriae]CAB0524754.1 hypothetical protein CIP101434_02011 [Corynebacterium diphtheriae]
MSAMAAIISAFGGLVTAIGGLWIGWVKLRSDVQAAKGSRMDKLEARLDSVQAQAEEDRRKRVQAETLAHRLRLGLITTMDCLEAMIRWAEGGAMPPPPVPPDLKSIKSLIED